jgi:hypothetical protein
MQWYIVALITQGLGVLGGFLLGKRSNRTASGVNVPPSPEVIKKIEERIKKAEELHETSDSLIADINDLLGIDTGDSG